MNFRFGIIMLVAIASLISGCGGSSSNEAVNNDPTQAEIDASTVALNTVAGGGLINSASIAGLATSSLAAMAIKSAAFTTDCIFQDASEATIDIQTIITSGDSAAIEAAFSSVVYIQCTMDCDVTGTFTSQVSNLEQTPLFVNLATLGMRSQNTYTDCIMTTSVCGNEEVDGSNTIVVSDISDSPCAATLSISSTEAQAFTVNDISMIYDLTYVIDSTVDCSDVDFSTATCDDMLSDDSTLTVNSTPYTKDEICAMVDDPTCT